MKRTFPFLAAFFLFVFVGAAAAAATEAEAEAPAQAEYGYRISWNGIPAANAKVVVTEDPAAHFAQLQADVRTNRVVDILYSLRATVWGAVDQQTWLSRGFSFHRVTSDRLESTRIEVGANGTLTGRYQRTGRDESVVEVDEDGVIDPITALLRLRHELPVPGTTTVHELFTGETRYRIELEYVGEETLRVPAGEFAAVRIHPRVWRVGRQDDRVTSVTAWATRDAPHTVLRVRSDVFIGAVYGDLTEIKRLGY